MLDFECFEEVNVIHLATLVKTETQPGQRELLAGFLKLALKNRISGAHTTSHVKVKYKCKNKDVGGRLYAQGPSLAKVSKRSRAIISVPAWDFDLVNVYPVLLRNLCGKRDIPCPVIKEYVANRDAWLNGTGIDKTDVIASLFGCEATTKSKKLAALRAELKVITANLTPLYPTLQKAVANLKPDAGESKLERTLMSYILQREEMDVISTVITRMTKEFPTLEMQAYIYDGFMVRKKDGVDPNHVLDQINTWVEELNVTFALKPFECPSDFVTLPKEIVQGADTDVGALRAMCHQFPHYLKMNGDKKFVFQRSTGLWTEAFGAFCNLLMDVHSDNTYGQSVSSMESIWRLMPTLADESAFFMAARRRAKGKLLFRDGIWDKQEQKRLEFTHEIYFAHAVPHDIPVTEPENVELVKAFHFTQPYPEPGVAEWRLQLMTRAVFGMGSDTMTMESGKGCNGKTHRALGFQEALGPKLACALDGKHVTVDKFNNGGGASPQLMELKDARIVFINDPPKGTIVDMALLKKLTGGDPIKARGLYKGLEEFTSLAMVHFNVNLIPNFSECEETSMRRRFHHLESNTQYLDTIDQDKPLEQIYKANKPHVGKMVASTDALLWLLINEPIRDVPVPETVKSASKETLAATDELKCAFDESYERDIAGRVASDELAKALKINPRDLAMRMKAWGYDKPKTMRIQGRIGTVNGYEGLRRKRQREDIDGTDEATEGCGVGV
jgi:hypothetical protein